jgi:hypothetical protein
MIDLLWRLFEQLWEQRNGRVHGVDTKTWSKIQKEKAHHELLALYALQDHTRLCDHNIFYDTPAEERLDAQPVWALKNWLPVYQPLVKHSIKEAVQLAIRNMQTIQSYFCQAKGPD